ncbi:hypothetical protein CEXT_208351, partial [Caerostris extrusa]
YSSYLCNLRLFFKTQCSYTVIFHHSLETRVTMYGSEESVSITSHWTCQKLLNVESMFLPCLQRLILYALVELGYSDQFEFEWAISRLLSLCETQIRLDVKILFKEVCDAYNKGVYQTCVKRDQ